MLCASYLRHRRFEGTGQPTPLIISTVTHETGIVPAAYGRRSLCQRKKRPRDALAERKRTRQTDNEQNNTNHDHAPQKSVCLSEKRLIGKLNYNEPRRTIDRTAEGHNGSAVSVVVRNL